MTTRFYSDNNTFSDFEPLDTYNYNNLSSFNYNNSLYNYNNNYSNNYDNVYNRDTETNQVYHNGQNNEYFTVYEPDKWNKQGIVEVHNCYAYAMDDYNPTRTNFPHPGVKAGYERPTKKDYVCGDMTQRIMADNKNILHSDHVSACPQGYRKVGLVIDPYNDYHFYRQEKDGTWSHKPGSQNAVNYDDSGNIIYDPSIADRNDERNGVNYTRVCQYLCVPPNTNVL